MGNTSGKVIGGIVLSLVGGLVFTAICLGRNLGVRKTENAYTFQYQGKPAAVKREDIRWGPDKYYFLLNEKDKLTGKLTTDNEKEINIYGYFGKNSNYSIKDKNSIQQ